jgi:hypothetical protein
MQAAGNVTEDESAGTIDQQQPDGLRVSCPDQAAEQLKRMDLPFITSIGARKLIIRHGAGHAS